jgi:hypothetical protein
MSFLMTKEKKIWLGANNLEVIWSWADGERFSYTNWAKGIVCFTRVEKKLGHHSAVDKKAIHPIWQVKQCWAIRFDPQWVKILILRDKYLFAP